MQKVFAEPDDAFHPADARPTTDSVSPYADRSRRRHGRIKKREMRRGHRKQVRGERGTDRAILQKGCFGVRGVVGLVAVATSWVMAHGPKVTRVAEKNGAFFVNRNYHYL